MPLDSGPNKDQRRLRIIHCVRAPIGGIFRHVLDLAAEQTARGHFVGIVLDSSSGGAFEAAKIGAAAPDLALGITRLPMSRSVRPGDLLSAWRVFRAVQGLKPDVLHGHGAKGGVFARVIGTLLSSRARPVIRFYTPHGGSLHYPRSSRAGRLYFAVERALERVTDGIIHVSRFEANAYREKIGAPTCGASIIVNGLRPDEFAPVETAAEASDLLFMGMMRDLKGPDVLIRAIAAVRNRTGRTPTAHFVGDGPDRDAYRQLASTLGVAEAVSFVDPMPTRDAFALGDVLIVPSRAESMPYIVLESIAAGLPLLATRVGGIPEIFGAAADRLLPAGDVDALADAIEAALADPEAARAGARIASKALRERFTVAAMTDGVERLYLAALARRRLGLRAAGMPSLQPAE